MKVSEHQYDIGIKGQGIKNRPYGSQHELLYSLIEILSMQVSFFILSGCLASNATPSMEDIHIYNSVCLRYVDDKKLSVLLLNVKYLKLKNIQKYLDSGSMACKESILY